MSTWVHICLVRSTRSLHLSLILCFLLSHSVSFARFLSLFMSLSPFVQFASCASILILLFLLPIFAVVSCFPWFVGELDEWINEEAAGSKKGIIFSLLPSSPANTVRKFNWSIAIMRLMRDSLWETGFPFKAESNLEKQIYGILVKQNQLIYQNC